MEETPYTETEALLMVMHERDSDAVLAYLREAFTVPELRIFVDQLDRLANLCEVVVEESNP